MPRKKINLNEVEHAFKVLERAGIDIQVKPAQEIVQQQFVVEPVRSKTSPYGSIDSHYAKVAKRTAKITLYAKHCVGSGGVESGNGDNKQIENAGVQTYGPGVCVVPVELVGHLLHADQQARNADSDMLSREPKYKLIVPRIDGTGNRANVAMSVPEDVLDAGAMLTQIASQHTYVIRG